MDAALSEFVALGVTTNIEFLRNALNHASFRDGSIDTDFLDNSAPGELDGDGYDEGMLVAIAAAAQRLGLGSARTGSGETVDEHTGHQGDPFRTLRRTFP